MARSDLACEVVAKELSTAVGLKYLSFDLLEGSRDELPPINCYSWMKLDEVFYSWYKNYIYKKKLDDSHLNIKLSMKSWKNYRKRNSGLQFKIHKKSFLNYPKLVTNRHHSIKMFTTFNFRFLLSYFENLKWKTFEQILSMHDELFWSTADV